MSKDPFDGLIFGLIVGGGLLVYGLGTLLAKRLSINGRVAFAAIIATGAGGIAVCCQQNGFAISMVVGCILLFTILTDRVWVGNFLRFVGGFMKSTTARWVLPLACGVIVCVGAILQYDRKQNEVNDRDLKSMERLTGTPELVTADEQYLLTDAGTRIEVQIPADTQELNGIEESELLQDMHVTMRIIQHEAASDDSNCHGWVFTGGKYWVLGKSVETILQQNQYEATKSPRPGDLVIYRNEAKVAHTAIVRYVTEGMPVLVEGKWGALGVYLHAVEESCYGRNYMFYRSPRKGHQLAETHPPVLANS